MTARPALVMAVVAAVSLAAQDPAPRFEVASIKQAEPPTPGTLATGAVGFLPGGRYVARAMAPERLLVLAFREEGSGTGLRPEQIIGAPSWMASTRYNIDARVAGPATTERIVDPLAARLLRSLLVERFQFTYHMEKRELPFYALVVDKPGTLGPNLKRSSPECDAEWRERGAARLAGRPPNLPAPVPGRPVCAPLSLGNGRGTGAGDMNTIANMLTGAAGNSTVLDRTGLEGGFDLELRFAPERQGGGPAATAPDPDAPSLFTAVREQLGLRLEQRREQRDVLIVDHIERPTPD